MMPSTFTLVLPARVTNVCMYLLYTDLPSSGLISGQPLLNPDGSAVLYSPSMTSQASGCQSSVAPPPAAQHQPTNHVTAQVSSVALMGQQVWCDALWENGTDESWGAMLTFWMLTVEDDGKLSSCCAVNFLCVCFLFLLRPALAAVLPRDPHSAS